MNKRRIRYTLIYTLALLLFNPWSFAALADDFHDAPYDGFFGNHIDTHQETKLKLKKGDPDSLKGFLYIIVDPDRTTDEGQPIYRHPRGAGQNEVCGVNVECEVGWKIKAVPGEAKFLYHSGVNGEDHPVWMVNRVDIPQKGSYTHFHWITRRSLLDPRAADMVPDFCNKNSASQLETQDPTAVNGTCPGWFLEIKAVMNFEFGHGNEVISVRKGDDNATHLNLVTNYSEVPGITFTR